MSDSISGLSSGVTAILLNSLSGLTVTSDTLNNLSGLTASATMLNGILYSTASHKIIDYVIADCVNSTVVSAATMGLNYITLAYPGAPAINTALCWALSHISASGGLYNSIRIQLYYASSQSGYTNTGIYFPIQVKGA